MCGGFDAGVERNIEFFERRGVRPRGCGRATDLGAGCGFQSIPLARAGFDVTAIDLDRGLLDELCHHDVDGRIRTVAGDLVEFADHIEAPAELAVCMTDTLLHLESAEHIQTLFERLHDAIESGGRFIATFRDLSTPLEGLDRFIPVRSDDTRILSCFLEYEAHRARVHDLLYQRSGGAWHLTKSYYYKLRISPDQARAWLLAAGFSDVRVSIENGFAMIVAIK